MHEPIRIRHHARRPPPSVVARIAAPCTRDRRGGRAVIARLRAYFTGAPAPRLLAREAVRLLSQPIDPVIPPAGSTPVRAPHPMIAPLSPAELAALRVLLRTRSTPPPRSATASVEE
jgi:hypothetical protein